MKNPAICPGHEPAFCSCGRRQVDQRTGNPVFYRRMICPRRRWWRPFHEAYLISANGVWFDESYLGPG